MLDTNTEIDVYGTAFHEAAHAVMAMMKGAMVYEIAVLDEPDERGRGGYCTVEKTGSLLRDVWVYLAGPAADTIHRKIGFLDTFLFHGSLDFDMAKSEFAKLLMPRVPVELRDYIGDDTEDYLSAAFDGWVPEGTRGQTKRKLTVFTKKCLEIDARITSQIYEEARQVRELVSTKALLDGVTHLANQLAAVRKMTGHEMVQVLKNFYEERKAAALTIAGCQPFGRR